MATPSDDEATISLPSLAFVAVLGFIIYRYFTSSSRSASPSSARVAGQRFTPAQVEQITAMFPQLNRRDIMWDLQRNGGSVAATTERILGGGGLSPVCSWMVYRVETHSNKAIGTTFVPTCIAYPTNYLEFKHIFSIKSRQDPSKSNITIQPTVTSKHK